MNTFCYQKNAGVLKIFMSFVIVFYVLSVGHAQTHFTPSITSGCMPLDVAFTNNNPSGGYQPISNVTTGFTFSWDFGNGQTSSAENPAAVTYSNSGNYTVKYEAFIDTIGFFLTEVLVTAIGCDDFGSWNDPDVYLEIFDGNNTMIFTNEHLATNGQPYNGVQPPILYSLNIPLTNPPYRIRVMDEDTGSSNDNCGDNPNGVSINLPPNDNTSFGITTATYTDGPLTFSTTIQKVVFQRTDSTVISVQGGPDINNPFGIYCLGDVITPLIASGSNIEWYDDSLLTNLVFTGDTLNIDTLSAIGVHDYYAIQSGSPCNVAAHAQIIIAPQGPSVNIPYAVYDVTQLVPDLVASGTNVKWYADAALTQLVHNGNVMPFTANQVGVYNFYVTQTDTSGQESCPNMATVILTTSALGFSHSNSVGCDSLTVNFVNNNPSNNYQPALWQTTGFSYSWDFGNGQTSAAEQPGSVLYDTPGTYNVSYEAIIDTVGFYLTSIHIWAIGCDDPNIWPLTNDPDIYIQLFDGNYNMIINTINQADNNTTPPNAPNVTFTMNVLMNNPPYYLKVMDKDSGNPDDNCIDGNEHDAATAIYYPLNDPSTFGSSSVQYTNNLLGFTATYFKPITIINDTALITVNTSPPPPFTNVTDTLFCNPAFVPDLVAYASNINWYADQGLSQHLHTGSPYDFTFTDEGLYSFYVTQTSAGGCESQPTLINIEIGDLPAPLATPNNEMYCMGEQLPVITVSGTDVKWYSDSLLSTLAHQGNTMPVAGLVPGDYTYYVTQSDNVQGCVSDYSVVNFGVRNLDFDFMAEDVKCHNAEDGQAEVLIISGQAPFKYQWSTGDSTQLAQNLNKGEYTVIVTDANFCLKMKSIFIQEPEPLIVTAEITDTKCARNEGSVMLDVSGGTVPYTYLWSNNANEKDLTAINGGVFRVTVTDFNNCEKTGVYEVDDGCLNIPGVITPNGDGINDVWYIENIDFYPDVIVEIYDRWGNQVFVSDGYATPWDGTRNGNPLPTASYFYVINYNNGFNKPLTGVVDIVR